MARLRGWGNAPRAPSRRRRLMGLAGLYLACLGVALTASLRPTAPGVAALAPLRGGRPPLSFARWALTAAAVRPWLWPTSLTALGRGLLRAAAGLPSDRPQDLLAAAGLPLAAQPPRSGGAAREGWGVSPAPPWAVHPPNARPPFPVPPPPDRYGSRPQVAIYHTDSTEAYLPALQAAGLPTSRPFSRDQAVSVVQVGAVLCQALERRGVGCVQSRAVNDPDGMLGAYANSLRTAQALLAAFPTVRLLLDLHRGPAGQGLGERHGVADLTVVVGTADRQPEPHWRQNLALARRLVALAERDAPGWPVHLVVSPNRYNQQLAPGALMLEVGTSRTSLGAADRAADVLARVVAQLLATRLVPERPR